MKFLKETEKAVAVRMNIELVDVEKEFDRIAWIPKSQLRNGNPTQWILDRKEEDAKSSLSYTGSILVCFFDADDVRIHSDEEEHAQERFEAGCENYERLIKIAIDNGVKGVRKGLRRTTIERKLTEAGIAF